MAKKAGKYLPARCGSKLKKFQPDRYFCWHNVSYCYLFTFKCGLVISGHNLEIQAIV